MSTTLYRRGRSIHRTKRSRPFFVYLNYTVPHAELRVPDDSLAQFRGQFPENPFVNQKADGRLTGASPDAVSLGYRSQPNHMPRSPP